MRHAGARILVMAVLAASTACGGTPAITLSSVAVGPSTGTVAKGLTVAFTATGSYSDGSSADLTARATWASADPAVAAVSTPGKVTGLAQGTTTISAAVEGTTGRATVVVGVPVPVGVTVSPASATVAKGLTQVFRASALRMSDDSAEPVTGAVSWTTSSAAVATVDAEGVASSTGVGTADLTATVQGVSGRGTLIVGPPVPVSVAVAPSTATVTRGGRQQYVATGNMTDGTIQDVTGSVTWSSADGQVAAVIAPGLVSGGPVGGTTTIRASIPAGSADVEIRVTPHRVAFLTSRQFTANLSAWPEAGGATGVAAADAICQSLAGSARVPGTFRAWISSTVDDAYCRIQGLSGKRSSGCGTGPVTTAGPWVALDGQPFAPVLEELVLGRVLMPLRRDELGHTVGDGVRIFTGTNPDGTLNRPTPGAPCLDWSAEYADPSAGGLVGAAGIYWTDYGGRDCNLASALACLEVAPRNGAELFPFPFVGKVAFVTSTFGTGKLATWPDAAGKVGIAAGDAICVAAATRAHLPRSDRFKAWLSDTTTNAVDRLTTEGPWMRMDGAPLASSRAALASGLLTSTISMDESGRWVGGLNDPFWASNTWTGSDDLGQSSSMHCGDWKVDSGAVGKSGNASLATGQWSGDQILGCAVYWAALYCFED